MTVSTFATQSLEEVRAATDGPRRFQRLAHPEGEAATARAAASLGIPMTVSTFATQSLEEVRAATDGPLWFQLYVHQDRGITREIVSRVAAAKFDALVLTLSLIHI